MDDILVIGSHEAGISALKQYLDDLFTIIDLGHAKYFLGLEISRTDQGTYLNKKNTFWISCNMPASRAVRQYLHPSHQISSSMLRKGRLLLIKNAIGD